MKDFIFSIPSDKDILDFTNSLLYKGGRGVVSDLVLKRLMTKVAFGNEMHKQPVELYKYLHLVKEVSVFLFEKKSRTVGSEFIYILGNKECRGIGEEIKYFGSYYDWVQAFQLCLILKDETGLNKLLALVNDPKNFEVEGLAPYSPDVKEVEFYQSLFTNDPSFIASSFKTVYSLFDFDKYPPISPEFEEMAYHLRVPMLDVYFGIISKDEDLYNKYLADSLIGLRKYVESTKFSDTRHADAFYFIYWAALAAIRFAELNGLKTHVTSEYLPQWLVDGNFEGLPTVFDTME
ncbi:Imm49 family immunity protein [Persicobacter diffluens]